MLSISGTSGFLSIEIELLIREAYERIGIKGEMVESQKLDSAKRAIDFLLLEWMSKTTNLWTLKTAYLPLMTSQGRYTLDNTCENIVQALLRSSTRQLNGTAASSDGGTAQNAFDGNPNTACTQNAPNGNISYDYGVDTTQKITFVGVTSNVTVEYSLVIEVSSDGATWKLLNSFDTQTFVAGVNVWIDIIAPVDSRYYRIRETGGATLDITEIYLNNNTYDYVLSNVSREEYYSYPNKNLTSRPNIYYLDRQITPVLFLYPVPSSQYNCLLYSYKKMMYETGMFYSDTVDIPARFYPALVSGLAYSLAVKYQPDKAAFFKAEYEQAFEMAKIDDTESVPITISGDTSCY